MTPLIGNQTKLLLAAMYAAWQRSLVDIKGEAETARKAEKEDAVWRKNIMAVEVVSKNMFFGWSRFMGELHKEHEAEPILCFLLCGPFCCVADGIAHMQRC